MNILIVSFIYPCEEDPRLGLFVHEQAKELVRRGNSVTVVTHCSGKSTEDLVNGIKIYKIASQNFLGGIFFSFKSFHRILSLKQKPDIIHLHFIGFGAITCWLASKIKNIPLVATVHGIDVCPKNFLHGIWIRFLLLFPKRIMAVSNFTYDLTVANANREKVEVVNNGADISKLKLKYKTSDLRKKLGLINKRILLSIGGLVERKGYDTVIKVLPKIAKKFPNIIYLIIGKGSEEQNLKKLAEVLDMNDHVRFLGYVSNDVIGNYYDMCDIFVLMSRTVKEKSGIEGFGIVFIEASAMGKPVIGGKSGGTGDAIRDNITGFRIGPGNTKELEKKIIMLLKDSKLRRRMGIAGRKIVLKNFLWKHNVEKTLKVYNKVLNH